MVYVATCQTNAATEALRRTHTHAQAVPPARVMQLMPGKLGLRDYDSAELAHAVVLKGFGELHEAPELTAALGVIVGPCRVARI